MTPLFSTKGMGCVRGTETNRLAFPPGSFGSTLAVMVTGLLKPDCFSGLKAPGPVVGGTGGVFPSAEPYCRVQPKGEGEAAERLRAQIVGSVTKSGEPHVYSSISKCVAHLASNVDDKYSKWLVVLSDTVDTSNPKPDVLSQMADSTVTKMKQVTDLNLAFIDTSGFLDENGNKYQPNNKCWPTWTANVRKLTASLPVGKGHHIEATNLEKIKEAFKQVAEKMSGGPSAS